LAAASACACWSARGIGTGGGAGIPIAGGGGEGKVGNTGDAGRDLFGTAIGGASLRMAISPTGAFSTTTP
jgi:hypothetical protein